MRAAVYHGAGDVRIEQVAEPAAPPPDAVVLDVLRGAICGTDAAEWSHGPVLASLESRHPVTGHRGPVVLGHEFVGRVAVIGADVEALTLGQRVVCGAGVSCGSCSWCAAGRTNLCERYYTLGFHTHGGLAEQVLAPARICRAVPAGMSDEAAALSQPLAVALHALRRAALEPGERVAVLGVGGIGAFILAAAAARGAGELIAVDIDPARLETARLLGAGALVDARSLETAAALRELTEGVGPDLVIEASGVASGPATAIAAARRGGRVLVVGLQAAPREIDLLSATIREVDIITTLAHVCDMDLPEAIDVLATTALAEVVIDRVIGLEELVDEGLRPLATGVAAGKIVVDPAR
jgi:(R,R)-butanediol dehydrogenase/meso-butanediol dehydrogenase/diacetyl reductase